MGSGRGEELVRDFDNGRKSSRRQKKKREKRKKLDRHRTIDQVTKSGKGGGKREELRVMRMRI
jgi:hypothetical protein